MEDLSVPVDESEYESIFALELPDGEDERGESSDGNNDDQRVDPSSDINNNDHAGISSSEPNSDKQQIHPISQSSGYGLFLRDHGSTLLRLHRKNKEQQSRSLQDTAIQAWDGLSPAIRTHYEELAATDNNNNNETKSQRQASSSSTFSSSMATKKNKKTKTTTTATATRKRKMKPTTASTTTTVSTHGSPKNNQPQNLLNRQRPVAGTTRNVIMNNFGTGSFQSQPLDHNVVLNTGQGMNGMNLNMSALYSNNKGMNLMHTNTMGDINSGNEAGGNNNHMTYIGPNTTFTTTSNNNNNRNSTNDGPMTMMMNGANDNNNAMAMMIDFMANHSSNGLIHNGNNNVYGVNITNGVRNDDARFQGPVEMNNSMNSSRNYGNNTTVNVNQHQDFPLSHRKAIALLASKLDEESIDFLIRAFK